MENTEQTKTDIQTIKFIEELKEKKEKRIEFKDVDKSINRCFYIAIKENKKSDLDQKRISKNFSFKHISFKAKDGSSVQVNISSASKRLGLTYLEVYKLSKNPEGLEKLEEVAKRRTKAASKYNELVKEYTAKRGNLIVENKKSNLTAATLLKAIDEGLKLYDNPQADHTVSVGRFNKKTFIIKKDASNVTFLEKRLGGGSFGDVHKALDVKNQEVKAVKISKKSGKKDLENEFETLNTLHEKNESETSSGVERDQNGHVIGLQSPLSTVYALEGGQEGYCSSELMSSDLACNGLYYPQLRKLPSEQKLTLCRQLVHGLNHMHNKGYMHYDIKPENCLMKCDSKGKPEKFVLADFGLASTEKNDTGGTRNYVPSDFKNGEDRDVFALSKTLLEVLTGEPIDLPKDQTQDGNRYCLPFNESVDLETSFLLRANLSSQKIPDEIVQILLDGISSREKRGSAKNLLKAFNQALSA